jgi:hypothetical protein
VSGRLAGFMAYHTRPRQVVQHVQGQALPSVLCRRRRRWSGSERKREVAAHLRARSQRGVTQYEREPPQQRRQRSLGDLGSPAIGHAYQGR